MVMDARGADDPGSSIVPVGLPQPITISTDTDGKLTGIHLRGRLLRVVEVRSAWRIEDRWWRTEPVDRLYLTAILEDGRPLTLFKDLLSGGWFRQNG